MKTLSRAFFLCLIGAVSSPATAATFDDPTWPCVQRKVEDLSLGIMWPHPVPKAAQTSSGGQDLADALALRRVSLEDGEEMIQTFVDQHPDISTSDLGAIFQRVFERISSDRRVLIKGIERYSLQQIALSEAVDETRKKMSQMMDVVEPDFDEIDRLEEKLDWDERIFRDRTQSLTYVCETPVLLEKRAYAIAQFLLQHVSD